MRNRPLLLGITGGIGSGKSTVCQLFAVLGIPVYNADDRAKWILSNDPEVKSSVISIFGEESFAGQEYNKSYMASIVFKSPGKLKELNNIVHPAVGRDFENWVELNSKSPYLVKEAALLFDSGSAGRLDYIAVVHAPEELRIKRVKRRDSHREESQIKNIIASQMSQEEMMKRASFLIDNSGSLLLIPQIVAINSSILSDI